MEITYVRNCTLHRVVDGDTIDVMVDLGFRRYSRERIRLAGIDAPETSGPTREDGESAAEFTKLWCDVAAEQGPLILDSHKKDSFGRWLGSIYRQDGASLADALIDNCYAALYKK